MTAKKKLASARDCRREPPPCVYLVDSAGIPAFASELFPIRSLRTLFKPCAPSLHRHRKSPRVSMHAAIAYVPAMCDEAIIVNVRADFFWGSPLVRARP